jgi:phospholipase C
MTRTLFGWMLALLCVAAHSAQAAVSNFAHIVVIVQENRTPDNLFHALCTPASLCSTQPGPGQYDIQTGNWLDKTSATGVTQPIPATIEADGMGHSHADFTAMCDPIPGVALCRMDGAAGVACGMLCPPSTSFAYVDNSTGILNPYLALVTQYGWANYMFQTNQGPSFPAHQFLFGGTSAPSAADDRIGIFASENTTNEQDSGCNASADVRDQLITPAGEILTNRIFPCFEHATLGDLLTKSGVGWRYYAPSAGSIWNAPNAINHICHARGQICVGATWKANVDLTSSDILRDVGNCALKNVSWVIPTLQNSDHPGGNTGGGPSWVASIVNAIGKSACKDASGHPYWQTTAIVITWDDWGGFYDHVAPTILPGVQGDYQYGFRVPLIFVSAYTPQSFIENSNRYDFGSVARFIEHNFAIPEGALKFSDARSSTDLSLFYNFGNAPRAFQTIPAPLDAAHFLNDKSPQLPPDDD